MEESKRKQRVNKLQSNKHKNMYVGNCTLKNTFPHSDSDTFQFGDSWIIYTTLAIQVFPAAIVLTNPTCGT